MFDFDGTTLFIALPAVSAIILYILSEALAARDRRRLHEVNAAASELRMAKLIEALLRARRDREKKNAGHQKPPSRRRLTTPRWYRILRVKEDATLEEIKAAHAEFVKRYHPDTAEDGKGDLEKFTQIRKAFAIGKARAERRSDRASNASVH